MTYGERDGIWHVLVDGKALCGAETHETTEPGRRAAPVVLALPGSDQDNA
jgi:hypothetical protein